jgi:hypothetical protein
MTIKIIILFFSILVLYQIYTTFNNTIIIEANTPLKDMQNSMKEIKKISMFLNKFTKKSKSFFADFIKDTTD